MLEAFFNAFDDHSRKFNVFLINKNKLDVQMRTKLKIDSFIQFDDNYPSKCRNNKNTRSIQMVRQQQQLIAL